MRLHVAINLPPYLHILIKTKMIVPQPRTSLKKKERKGGWGVSDSQVIRCWQSRKGWKTGKMGICHANKRVDRTTGRRAAAVAYRNATDSEPQAHLWQVASRLSPLSSLVTYISINASESTGISRQQGRRLWVLLRF